MSSSPRPLFALWDDSLILNAIRYSFSLVGFFSNVFLIWIILSTKMRLHQCNWYMLLLTIADIAIAIGQFIRATYAIYASSMGIVLYSRWTCVLVNSPMGIGFTMTRIAVLALAADRLYLVLHPLTYNSKFNKSLFALIFCLDLAFAFLDSFFKFYGIDDSKPIPLCSMGSSAGPGSAIFGQFYSNSCLIFLFAFYIPFLIIYRRKCTQQGITASWNWRRQFEVTGTTIWLLLVYAFLWGGSYSALLFVNLFTENGQFYAGYITYIFGFISSACSSASFFVYLKKHADIQKQTRILLARIFLRNEQQYSGNKVFSITARNCQTTPKNVSIVPEIQLININNSK